MGPARCGHTLWNARTDPSEPRETRSGHPATAPAHMSSQIVAAKEAGWRFLRTQNDLGNAPMRRVNEKLGYELKFEWVHLVGPLI